jgi:predicted DNA-binding protein with PD1-like motif
MSSAKTPLMTRRGFCVAAGLSLAACAAGAVGAPDIATNDTDGSDIPDAQQLSDGDIKTYLLVYHTGQEVMKGLLAFARDRKLVAGHVTGIGAISDAVIAYFDPKKKIYMRVHEQQQREVLSVTGNLPLYNGEPFYHVHVALGLEDGSAHGGHLFAMTVRPTVELILTTYSKPIERKIDPAWGLPLINV